MASYSKYPLSAFTVNTGQQAKQQKAAYAPTGYRPPTASGPVGGFANPGYSPPTSSLPGIAPHVLAAAADAVAGGTTSGTTDGSGSTSTPGAAGGTGAPPAKIPADPSGGNAALLTPEQRASLAMGMAYAQQQSTLQAPINPSGLASTTGQQYWVPNGQTIAGITGYTGPQIGSGLYNGAAGEPDLPGYAGVGALPGFPAQPLVPNRQVQQPGSVSPMARAAAILAGGR